ncbi:MAG TPA: NBR1-Ig-like domain-containing protein [Anaerolineaceae bacterium]|nr:NBR1-Ig-like domain-containing protein [Anaerolineaceae bacterium]
MKNFYLAGVALLLISLLSACKPMTEPTLTSTAVIFENSELLQTSIAKVTSEAAKTQMVAKATQNPLETQNGPYPSATNTPIPLPTETPIPPTPTLPCNLVQAGNPIDISIPDGSVFYPGQEFVKTWRITNGGSCAWTMLYKYSYYSGNPMGAHQENRLITEVQPGQVVDISVPFTAPEKLGEFESAWMMQDEAGNFFGMGLNADAPFYVKIRVEAAPAATTSNP